MQVLILLCLIFSDSFAFGLRDMFHYDTKYAIGWAVVSLVVMYVPYFRLPCYDESSTFD
jgi:hypothetical protein